MDLETSLISFGSIILFAMSPRPVLGWLLNIFNLSSFWEARAGAITLILVAYGLLFLFLVASSFILHRKGKSLSLELILGLRNFLPAFHTEFQKFLEPGLEGSLKIWPILILLMGAGIRVFFVNQPMRGDEAYTFLNFANKGIVSLFDYPVPNNHVFNTLLIKLSTLIWGASPATIRLSALIAGIAVIPLAYQVSRSFNPRKNSGILAGLGSALFPYLILYSTNARGYSLVTFLTLLMSLVALRYLASSSIRKIVVLSILAALGIWAVPSMIFAVSGIFVWLIACQMIAGRQFRKIVTNFAIPFGVLSAVFTFILYTPVILVSNGLEPIIANKFVESQSWPEFIGLFGPKIISTFSELSRDVPAVVIIISLVLGVFGLCRSLKNREWRLYLLLPALILGALLVILIQHTVPYARLWIYILPLFLVLLDYGFVGLVEHLGSRMQSYLIAALTLAGFIYVVHLASANIITNYPDTSAFPEAPIAAQYLKPILASNDVVRVSNTADWSVYFYLWYYGVPYDPESRPANPGKTFIIVKKSRYSLSDMTDKPVVKLLDFEDLAMYQVVDK